MERDEICKCNICGFEISAKGILKKMGVGSFKNALIPISKCIECGSSNIEIIKKKSIFKSNWNWLKRFYFILPCSILLVLCILGFIYLEPDGGIKGTLRGLSAIGGIGSIIGIFWSIFSPNYDLFNK